MNDKELITSWLKRSKSNLEIAKAGKVSEDVMYEDLCFQAQQSVEKSLKAFAIKHGRSFPRKHSIGLLLKILEDIGVEIPDQIKEAKILTDYAVETRYPGDYEPVTMDDYNKAITIAEDVYNWVLNKFVEGGDNSRIQ